MTAHNKLVAGLVAETFVKELNLDLQNYADGRQRFVIVTHYHKAQARTLLYPFCLSSGFCDRWSSQTSKYQYRDHLVGYYKLGPIQTSAGEASGKGEVTFPSSYFQFDKQACLSPPFPTAIWKFWVNNFLVINIIDKVIMVILSIIIIITEGPASECW